MGEGNNNHYCYTRQIAIYGLIIAVLTFFLGFSYGKSSLAREMETLADYEKTYWCQSGVTMEGIYYNNICTFDGGKNRYAVTYNNDGGIKILGTIEEIYPGLLEKLKAQDK